MKKPTRVFTYPNNGGHMCKDGKIRAAVWGVEILNDEGGGHCRRNKSEGR